VDKLLIQGGTPLAGEVAISGAKNAALPILCASLLSAEPLQLANVPHLNDIATMLRLLAQMGVEVTLDGSEGLALDSRVLSNPQAPYDMVKTMRASILVLGPLLARCGEAKVSLPGGCAIGARPVDQHIKGLQAMGAPGGLVGNKVTFPKVSVGATHVILMAATLARGETVIENAAREPEVVDVANCLIAMGARISGAGTSTIVVEGVDRLRGARHRVVSDRIETGTYAMAVAMTGGDVLLEGAEAALLQTPIDVLRRVGAEIEETNLGLRIRRNGAGIVAADITTDPFPGFPTDLQAQFMALMTRARGTSRIAETIFENRFMHVAELARFGAKISLEGQVATVEGVERLRGAPVMATDLRASVSLVIAGLAAEGETVINRVYHLDRGFERLEEKIGRCGAIVERISG